MAPRPLFFHNHPVIALILPPLPRQSWIPIWFVLVMLIGLMTRWWPTKAWPFYVWGLSFFVGLLVLAMEYPWLWWLYGVEIAFAVAWNYALSKRGPNDRDDD